VKFNLKTTEHTYGHKHPDDAKKLAKLRALGFEFTVRSDGYRNGDFRKGDKEPEIEFSTVEEIVAFCTEWGDLVLSVYGGAPSIEIYDDYRE
jgi:hypothetical protein